MNKQNNKYKHLRLKLEEERDHLQGDLDSIEDSGRPAESRRDGSPFGKREEEATESLELEKRLALEKQMREHLSEIESALKKFEDGTYGLCDMCGKPISPDRLEVMPRASLCVECKAKAGKNRVAS